MLRLKPQERVMAKFTGTKHITDGVRYEIGELMQQYLWQMVESIRGHMELDYLQVFELDILPSGIQVVTHRMEQPLYKRVYYLVELPIQFAFKKTVYVIDNDAYVTMMLAEEY
jgi:hypothetical protein